MTKNPNKDQVGDSLSQPLQPSAAGLCADSAITNGVHARSAPRSICTNAVADLARRPQASNAKLAVAACHQTLWFSFFFDGTGNNMDADEGTMKHSNVAKLYRVHVKDSVEKGIYRFYVPGVGTYFQEVGDEGGSALGLGAGKHGDERLEWALKRFDYALIAHERRATNPSNKITEINFAVSDSAVALRLLGRS